MPQATAYTPRFSTPALYRRGVESVAELPVYLGAGLAAPASGTFSLFDATGPLGVPVVDEAAVTVASSVATYTVAAAVLPTTLGLSERWQERWTLLMPDGLSYVFWRDAALVLRVLHSVVTDQDMTARHSDLRAWLAEDSSSLQGYRDSAWDTIQLRLMEGGKRPNLIMSPWSLRGVHLDLSLAYAFHDYSSSAAGGADDKYAQAATRYMEAYEDGWARLALVYDYDQSDTVGGAEHGVSGEPVLMAVQPANWTRGAG